MKQVLERGLTMKEIKDVQIKARFTKSEKEAIEKYCEKHGMTVSALIRQTMYKYIEEVRQSEREQ